MNKEIKIIKLVERKTPDIHQKAERVPVSLYKPEKTPTPPTPKEEGAK